MELYNDKVKKTDSDLGDEISFSDILKILWTGKSWIIIFFLIASVIIVFYAISLPNKYQSNALLVPSDEAFMEGGFSQYSNLTKLAGISMPGKVDQASTGLAVLKSRVFIEHFIESRDILVPLMASESWDNRSGNVIIDKDLYDEESKKWIRNVSFPKTVKPSLKEAYIFWVKEIFTVTQENKTKLISMRIEHHSPIVAQEWASMLIEDLNNYIRDRDVKEAQKSIEFLNTEVAKTNSEELKQLYYNVIQSKTEKKMLAYSRPEYLFRVIDPPFIPEIKSSPRRSIICILGAILGIIIGSFFVLIRHFINTQHHK
tara:strand:- start:2558 stop:3502 length:945 start_codon:yes stop_codon:yes gene_type:complete